MRDAGGCAILEAMPKLRIIDSITELSSRDVGCIAISGSHGGISSARYAQAAQPLLSVFNDAGVGKALAGIAGLAFLQERGLAACAVAYTSALIGEAQSTWDEGIISYLNAQAHALGVRVGQTCQAVVQHVQHTAQ